MSILLFCEGTLRTKTYRDVLRSLPLSHVNVINKWFHCSDRLEAQTALNLETAIRLLHLMGGPHGRCPIGRCSASKDAADLDKGSP